MWQEWLLFSGKAFVVLFVVLSILITLAVLIARNKSDSSDQLEVKDLGKKLDRLADGLRQRLLSKKSLKALKKQKKSDAKKEKTSEDNKGTIFVLDFDGDVRASRVEQFKDEITALLQVADPNKDEVVVTLESPGGVVHGYGLAASQLLRIKQGGLKLTVCVDKVAASGGYMMACTADEIFAAPFAILGSIGVLAQIPNFHRLLKKNDVDFKVITAGEYKRTLTLFGENTEKGEEKFKQQIQETHDLFKGFVAKNRPSLNIEKVATGEYWYGEQALELGLIDKIQTSDSYLVSRKSEKRILKLRIKTPKSLGEKLAEGMTSLRSQFDRSAQEPQSPSWPHLL